MQIEKIILKDFGGFVRESLKFGPGLNVLFGPNFAGKSTAVGAMFFCLTGRPLSGRVKASDFARLGAPSGTVGLTIRGDDGLFQLFRSTRGEVQWREWRNGQWDVVSSDKAAVQDLIRKRLGVAYHRLAAASFLAEGEIAEFLARNPSDRRDLLHALLGLDDLLAVRELFIKGRRQGKREEKGVIEHQKSLRIDDVGDRRAQIERLQAELSSLEQKRSALLSRVASDVNAALRDELRRTLADLSDKLGALDRKQSAVLGNFESASHIKATLAEVQDAQGESERLQKMREELLVKIARLTTDAGQLGDQIKAISDLLDAKRRICPTCHQPVSVEVLRNLLAQWKTELPPVQGELAEAQGKLKEHDKQLEVIRQLLDRVGTIRDKLNELATIESEVNLLKEQRSAAEAKLKELGELAASPVEERPEDLERQIKELHERMNTLTAEDAVIQRNLAELNRVQRQAAEARRNRLRFELGCDAIDKTLAAALRDTLGPAEDALGQVLAEFGLFAQAQADIRSQQLLPMLNWPQGSRSLAALSGSEKMLLYLGLKKGLAHALGSPGFFVFDDPTLHLDQERRRLLAQFVDRLSEQDQVIVTTNDDALLEAVEPSKVIRLGDSA